MSTFLHEHLEGIRIRLVELHNNVEQQKVVVVTDVSDLCEIVDDLVRILQDGFNQVKDVM
jgi:hypothetical protein